MRTMPLDPYPPMAKRVWGFTPYKRDIGYLWRTELLMMGANGRPQVMESPQVGMRYYPLIVCPECGYNFKSATDYRIHWLVEHYGF
jgi:hypothetical protein